MTDNKIRLIKEETKAMKDMFESNDETQTIDEHTLAQIKETTKELYIEMKNQ